MRGLQILGSKYGSKEELGFFFQDNARYRLDFPTMEERYRTFHDKVLSTAYPDEPLLRSMRIYGPSNVSDSSLISLLRLIVGASQPYHGYVMSNRASPFTQVVPSEPGPRYASFEEHAGWKFWNSFFNNLIVSRFCGTQLVVQAGLFRRIYGRSITPEDGLTLPYPPFVPLQALVHPNDSPAVRQYILNPCKRVPILVDRQILKDKRKELLIQSFALTYCFKVAGYSRKIHAVYFDIEELPRILALPAHTSKRNRFIRHLLLQDGSLRYPLFYPVRSSKGIASYPFRRNLENLPAVNLELRPVEPCPWGQYPSRRRPGSGNGRVGTSFSSSESRFAGLSTEEVTFSHMPMSGVNEGSESNAPATGSPGSVSHGPMLHTGETSHPLLGSPGFFVGPLTLSATPTLTEDQSS